MAPAGAAGKKAPAPAATKKTAAEPPTDQKTEAERLKERDKLIAARNQLEREELQRRNNNNNNSAAPAPKEEEEEKPLTPQVTEGDSQPPSTAHTKVNEQRLESSPKNEVTPEKTNPSPREASADVGRETSNARVVEVHPDDKNTNDVSASPVRDDEETKIFHKTPPPHRRCTTRMARRPCSIPLARSSRGRGW
ncbi:hypothetical protein AGDE_16902 [Angomonas deanei]|nr:hypothetical protein AGDE_16902 [Angomonas deanei]|eukprot:EPY15929.1 hypothetical protein AGDE_16902 [Angomonas deanei]